MAEAPNGTQGMANGLSELKEWLGLIGLVVGPLLAIVLGYAAAKSTAAAERASQEQRLVGLELKFFDQQKQLDYFRENYVLLREFQRQLDEQSRTLGRIENNQNALRNGR